MGFPGFLVKGGMRAGFCSWRPQGPRGSGRPPCNWETPSMCGTGLAGVRSSAPALSCPGGRAGGRSGLGFSGEVEHPQPVFWARDC